MRVARVRIEGTTSKELNMPFAQIFLMEGRSEEQMRAVIEKVSDALVEATGSPRENVRVWIQEVPKTQWGIAGKTAKDLGR
ncbi:MAG: 2-hydroxymuconate tautomerase [Azovibrio sp.]|uniref:2-hydroxymuconate tautomerase n=1 Tax=Azovibrio sp. TaxID=1872673 RepID=UPI003C760E5B